MRTLPLIPAAILIIALGSGCRKVVVGCNDPAFSNYDPEATENNGCCCSIVRNEQDGAEVMRSFTLPFPNIPDTVESGPTISLRAYIERMDQTAEGPCGCLQFQNQWMYFGHNSGLYASPYQSYSAQPSTYAPRAVCYTFISWSATPSQYPLDTSIWNAISTWNILDSIGHPIWVSYRLRFRATGTPDRVFHYTDTLRGYAHPYTNSGLYLTWGGWYNQPKTTHRIADAELACTEYPLHDQTAIIDSVSAGFLQ